MKTQFLALTVLCVVLLASPRGEAATPLGVGLYAPDLMSAGPAERFNYIRGIAAHLSTVLGVPVEGYAYKTAADFEKDLRTHRIHFAILGSVYMATKRAYKILATASLKNPKDAIWSILCKTKRPFSSLKGKSLQIPNLGAISLGLVENMVLGGAVKVKEYFTIKRTPDINSAITAVKLGVADAVLAPVSAPGLVPVLEGVKFPSPAFVLLDKKLNSALVSKAASAIFSYGAGFSSLKGWHGANAGAYNVLAGASKKRVYRMMLTTLRPVRLQLMNFVGLDKLKFSMPKMESTYWVP